jgi:hypothetical protein
MKSKPMLFNKISGKEKNNKRVTIGLLGTRRGTGLTYTGLMLAFYMGEELGKKTAFLECNSHRDFNLLQAAYTWSVEETFSFSFHRITCFKEVTKNGLVELYNEDYDCIIFDFGIDLPLNRDEFLRCDIKIIVGGQAEWDRTKLKDFINTINEIRGNDNWLYFIPFANLRTIHNLRKELKRKIYSVPLQAEPTVLTKVILCLFHKIPEFNL